LANISSDEVIRAFEAVTSLLRVTVGTNPLLWQFLHEKSSYIMTVRCGLRFAAPINGEFIRAVAHELTLAAVRRKSNGAPRLPSDSEVPVGIGVGTRTADLGTLRWLASLLTETAICHWWYSADTAKSRFRQVAPERTGTIAQCRPTLHVCSSCTLTPTTKA
jgi:hypothetical protein